MLKFVLFFTVYSLEFSVQRTPKSLATIQQFEQLSSRVLALQSQYADSETQISQDLTDPMTIIHLSGRLNSAEKSLGGMLNVLYAFVKNTPGIMETAGNVEAIPGIFSPTPIPEIDENDQVNAQPKLQDSTSDAKPKSSTLCRNQTLHVHFALHEVLKPIPEHKTVSSSLKTIADVGPSLYDASFEIIPHIIKQPPKRRYFIPTSYDKDLIEVKANSALNTFLNMRWVAVKL